jgi:hypothetical protein
MATVPLRNPRKSFRAREVIEGIDLAIADREFAVPVGSSATDPAGPGTATEVLVERLARRTRLHGSADRGQAMTARIKGSAVTCADAEIRPEIDAVFRRLFDNAGQALPRLGRHPRPT